MQENSRKFSNIRSRILQYLDYKDISKYLFYQTTGFSNGFLDKNSAIGSDKCEVIIYHYPDLSLYWLIAGEGPMLKSDKNLQVDNSSILPLNSIIIKNDEDMYTLLLQNNKGTHYFDGYTSAGFISGITEGRIRPDAVILIPGLDDCDFAINVYGDSMYPKYCSGEIAMCKEMLIDLGLTYIRFGEAYVVVLDDGIVLKYIQPGQDKEHLMFESENPQFKPYQVHKSRIQKMYLVKGVITRKNF